MEVMPETAPPGPRPDSPSESGSESPLEARSREGALRARSLLATIGLVVGVLGGTAIAFGLVLYALDPKVLPLTTLNVAVGLIAVVFYAITNAKSLARAFAGRGTALVGLEALMVLGVAAGLFAANVVASRSDVEWDLTRDRLYSLQDQSVEVASRLSGPVEIVAFLRPSDPMRARLVELVELYARHTEHLRLELVNPDTATPAQLAEHDMNRESPRIVVAAKDGRKTKIKQPTEELLTNALVRIDARPKRKVVFIGGHGGPRLDDEKSEAGYARAANDLRDDGYVVELLSLLDREAVPKDVSVVILGPTDSPLLASEAALLRSWVEAGGRLLVLLDPGRSSGLEDALLAFGFEIGDDLVVDPNAASRGLGFGADAPLIERFEPHPITDPLAGSAALFFGARSVAPRVGARGLQLSTLARTSPKSWAERRYQETTSASRDEDDAPGPISIAVAASRSALSDPARVNDEARVVVFGDSNFADNRFGAMSGNGDLLLNAVAWLAGEDARITLRPKTRGSSRLLLREDQQYGIMFFSVNLLPLMIIGFGFSVWAVRRRR